MSQYSVVSTSAGLGLGLLGSEQLHPSMSQYSCAAGAGGCASVLGAVLVFGVELDSEFNREGKPQLQPGLSQYAAAAGLSGRLKERDASGLGRRGRPQLQSSMSQYATGSSWAARVVVVDAGGVGICGAGLGRLGRSQLHSSRSQYLTLAFLLAVRWGMDCFLGSKFEDVAFGRLGLSHSQPSISQYSISVLLVVGCGVSRVLDGAGVPDVVAFGLLGLSHSHPSMSQYSISGSDFFAGVDFCDLALALALGRLGRLQSQPSISQYSGLSMVVLSFSVEVFFVGVSVFVRGGCGDGDLQAAPELPGVPRRLPSLAFLSVESGYLISLCLPGQTIPDFLQGRQTTK
jgi:hypothetical protein